MKLQRSTFILVLSFAAFGLLACSRNEPPQSAPFRLAEGLLDQHQAETLGLEFAPAAETYNIFRPGPDDNKLTHGVVLMPFKDRLYAMWQASARDEDGDNTHVMYSVSHNGEEWGEPELLAPTMEHGIRTSGGWWTDGETLIAYINTWPEVEGQPPAGHTMYRASTNGSDWSELAAVTDGKGEPMLGVIEQDPHRLPGGRLLTAFHMQPGLIMSPWYTDDPLGITGWTRGTMQNLPHDEAAISREIEPSWYLKPDDTIVMVMRDQASTHFKLAAESRDRGATWSMPVLTNVPDSRSKQSAGNLPDGRAFLVGNPTEDRDRFPLVILLSVDGELFDRAWVLRSGDDDMQPQRYAGQYKRVGFSYPKSVLWNGYLYVGYATNKEDAELTRVPVARL